MDVPILAGSAISQGSAEAPYLLLNPESESQVLVFCDHASSHIPAAYGRLGLAPDRLNEHIAIDIGAGDVARSLALALDCTAVLCGTSRLVIDCNRQLDDETSIPEFSDGIDIPGNRGLSDVERHNRYERYFKPYHDEIVARLDAYRARDVVPLLVSVHSFTPAMADGGERPWQVAVLWDEDDRIARAFVRVLREDASLMVGENKPYSGTSPLGYALKHYGNARGLPMAALELRQDLISDPAGVDYWSAKLSDCVRRLLSMEEVLHIRE